MRRMYLITAVRRHEVFAAVIAAVVVAVAATIVMLGVVMVIDVTATVIGVGPMILCGLIPSSNGATGVLQRFETFLHALRKRQVGARVSQ